jgi:hypothetical protein
LCVPNEFVALTNLIFLPFTHFFVSVHGAGIIDSDEMHKHHKTFIKQHNNNNMNHHQHNQEREVKTAGEERETVKKPNVNSNSKKKDKNTPKSYECWVMAAVNASATTELPVLDIFEERCVKRFG